METTRKISKALLLSALLSFFTFVPAKAQPPDFSVCDGLTGAAWGLCRGGVAAGCADGTGNPTACESIETTFSSVTGSDAPWLEPPVTCPCDYNVVPKTSMEWAHTAGGAITFTCPSDTARVQDDQAFPVLTGIQADIKIIATPFCIVVKDGDTAASVTQNIIINSDEFAACHQDVINYGIALKSVLAATGETFNDTCTPTL